MTPSGVWVAAYATPPASTRIASIPTGLTRHLLLTASTLEDGQLCVVTEYLLECRHHLALGYSGPRAVENRRHQVHVRRRGRLQIAQRALPLCRVPPRLGRLHPPLLLALELRVDAQGRDLLGVLDVVVHADDDPLLRVDLLLVAE